MNPTLACLDMAGTTVADDGTVMAAFTAAMHDAGLQPDTRQWSQAFDVVTATMGQSKIEVFTRILGDRTAADRANRSFETAYAESVARGDVAEIPGAGGVLDELRASGVKVCLTTGFSPSTRDGILTTLDWHDRIDLALSPADAGRGRPWPDMIWTAAMRLAIDGAGDILVVGDTESDIETGCRSGAGLVVGVQTGAGQPDRLLAAGAHRVVADVTALIALIDTPVLSEA